MQEKARQIYNNVLSKWQELEKRQKIQVFAIGIIVLLSIGIASYLATRPDWVTLVNNKSQAEISQIQTVLQELGYKTKLGNNGTSLEVEKKSHTQATVDLSIQDIAVDDYFSFSNALDVSGISATESMKKAALIKNAESELAQRLMMIDGIEKAKVTLAMPENNNYFIPDSEKPTASVSITTSKAIDKTQAEGMASLVAAGVVGLSKEDIEIIDQSAKLVWSGDYSSNSFHTTQDEIVLKRKNELENEIREVFAPLYDEVRISSNLEFNWDKNKVITRVVTPPIDDSETGLPSSSTEEKQKISNGNVEAAEGIDANDNMINEYQIGSSVPSTLDSKNSQVEYIYNEKEEITEQSEGKLVADNSTMTINVYKYKNYFEEVLSDRGDLENQSWDDFKYENGNFTKIEIDEDLIESAKKGTGIENISFIGYEIPKFIDKEIKPTSINDLLIYGLLLLLVGLLAYGIIKATKPDEIINVEPELSVQELLLSSQIDKQKEAEIQKQYEEFDFNDNESENKKQIEKFVDEKPEAVAQLLRNWLNDGWE